MPPSAPLTAALLFAAALPGQTAEDLVGVYRLKPDLVPSLVLDRILEPESPYPGNPLVALKLPLHESVPARVWLTKGKRATLFRIDGEPPLPKSQFIVPGLLDLEIEYDERSKRTTRFAIDERQSTLLMSCHSGSLLRLGRMEVCFLDLNHDGALGGPLDGFALREQRSRQWVKPGLDLKVYKMSEPLEIGGQKLWFDVDRGGFSATLGTTAPDLSIERRKEYARGLAELNALRKQLGHEPVGFDPSLSEACEKHCLYCVLNGATHDEESGKPGYSKEGARAGKLCQLSPASNMVHAVHRWVGGFFHRIAMLSPCLKQVGMGLVNGHAALDTGTHYERGDFVPYAWPPDGATDVPVTWTTSEHPHPLGKHGPFELADAKSYGYPITLTFPDASVKDVAVELRKAGGEPCRVVFSSPEKPAQPAMFPDNMDTVFLMSEGQMSRSTSYEVTVTCTFHGKAFERKWKFTTKAD